MNQYLLQVPQIVGVRKQQQRNVRTSGRQDAGIRRLRAGIDAIRRYQIDKREKQSQVIEISTPDSTLRTPTVQRCSSSDQLAPVISCP